jgi:galactoside O-acetyltransferase
MINASIESYKFQEIGKDVTIYQPTSIINEKNYFLKSNIIIAEYCWLMASNKTYIGNFTHIACHSSFSGGNLLLIEDFVSLSAGVRLIPGSDIADGSCLINSTVPEDYRGVRRSFIHIEKFAFLATNVVCYPGVTIGEGAVVGAGSIVTKDIEPWTVNIGFPAKPVSRRPKEKVLELANRLYAEKNIQPFIPDRSILELKIDINTRPGK